MIVKFGRQGSSVEFRLHGSAHTLRAMQLIVVVCIAGVSCTGTVVRLARSKYGIVARNAHHPVLLPSLEMSVALHDVFAMFVCLRDWKCTTFPSQGMKWA